MIRENIRMDVKNLTCTGNRKLSLLPEEMQDLEEDALFLAYADALLTQMPCFRMNTNTRRNQLYLDPALKGIINALEEKLGAKLYICDEAQLCGALGASLFAYEKCTAEE